MATVHKHFIPVFQRETTINRNFSPFGVEKKLKSGYIYPIDERFSKISYRERT